MVKALEACVFVGVSDSKEKLQKFIDVVYSYCNRWKLKANVCKSAAILFTRNKVEGELMDVGRA